MAIAYIVKRSKAASTTSTARTLLPELEISDFG
jgi:hypothetical protein